MPGGCRGFYTLYRTGSRAVIHFPLYNNRSSAGDPMTEAVGSPTSFGLGRAWRHKIRLDIHLLRVYYYLQNDHQGQGRKGVRVSEQGGE